MISSSAMRRVLDVGWRIVGVTILTWLVVEGGCQLYLSRKNAQLDAKLMDLGARGETGVWARAYFAELTRVQASLSAEDFVLWRSKPHDGEYIHVSAAGLRRTWNPSQGGLPRVWIFGGSTVWGWGQRDDQTIPSVVSRRLKEMGAPAELLNAGQIAYFSTQELNLLLRMLQSGERRPDVVVFVDGVNESLMPAENGGAHIGQGGGAWQRNRQVFLPSTSRAFWWFIKRTASYRVLTRPGKAVPIADVTSVSDQIARIYVTNVRAIEALASAFKFKVLFYWQPTLVDKTAVSPLEAEAMTMDEIVWHDFAALWRASSAKVKAELAGDPAFRDLGLLFNAETGTVFPDTIHYNERAAAKLAERLANDLAPVIHSRP